MELFKVYLKLVLPSAICMNKGLTKRIVKTVGVNTAKWLIVKSVKEIDYKKIKELQYPVFIKPNNGGSSVATFLVRREDEVEMAVREGLKYDNEIIIEEYINGEEITSFVLNGEVFPTVMIKSKKGEFFDYVSKYDENGSAEEVVILEEKLQEKINNISKKVWDILGCNSYARIDMIVSDGVPYLLEVNTLPGMTKQSLIPKNAKVRGLEFSELLDKIIESSLL